MDDVELLSGILSKTGDVIAGVRPDQRELSTPCDDFDVSDLTNHLVGWIQVFEAGCNERIYQGDAGAYRCGADPAAEFRASAAALEAGWATYGQDRQVRIVGDSRSPGEMVFNMILMEYLAHGWDLAVATGQPVPYTEHEASETLARAKKTLPPEYRGDGMPFGPVVSTDPNAPAVDRFVAFLGRHP